MSIATTIPTTMIATNPVVAVKANEAVSPLNAMETLVGLHGRNTGMDSTRPPVPFRPEVLMRQALTWT